MLDGWVKIVTESSLLLVEVQDFIDSPCSLFVHHKYDLPKWCYLVLNAAHGWLLLTMTYFMTPLHSLVDGP